MLLLVARRLASMLLIMAVVSLHPVPDLREQQAGRRGQGAGPLLRRPSSASCGSSRTATTGRFLVRYVEWVGKALQGDFGNSIRFKAPVSDLLWDRLANTGILALCVFAIMIPLSLAARRAVGDARGLGAGSKYLVPLDPHHLGAGVRLGDLPGGPVRVQAAAGCPAPRR